MYEFFLAIQAYDLAKWTTTVFKPKDSAMQLH